MKINEIAFSCYPVTDMAFVRDPDGNSVGIYQRKPGHT